MGWRESGVGIRESGIWSRESGVAIQAHRQGHKSTLPELTSKFANLLRCKSTKKRSECLRAVLFFNVALP